MLKTVMRAIGRKPKCQVCGRELPPTPTAVFCSRECYDHHRYREESEPAAGNG
ncbi:hypothetical protein [Pseudarthrobacter enclensis]|uniref:hypothetical protein n=1 Tax=Pseudarthrobacter enclensis TaxID=993070 RepID=UPI003EDEAC44